MTIFYCRGCGRYLQPPRHWVKAELESRELLTFCVKRIRGLGKVFRRCQGNAHCDAVSKAAAFAGSTLGVLPRAGSIARDSLLVQSVDSAPYSFSMNAGMSVLYVC